MNMISDNIQKILGALAAISGAVVSFAAAGGLNQIVGARELQILGLINVVLGAATVGSGYATTAKVKIAEAIQTAIQATPPRQGGFASVALLIVIAVAGMLLLSGCASTGAKNLDAGDRALIETTVRIAVRHAVEDSPRAAAKAQNIRNVVAKVRGVADAAATVAGIEALVREEVAKLELSPVDRADANDLVSLLAVALESRLQGPDAVLMDAFVPVSQFLDLVLAALPAGA